MMNNKCSVRKCASRRKCVCVCDRGLFCVLRGHTACPPETDYIRSNGNRAACPHHNRINAPTDTNQTSMHNWWRIDAKQLTAASHDVFEPHFGARQTDREPEGTRFNTVWHVSWERRTKNGEFPRIWLKVQPEFQTRLHAKVSPSEVASAPEGLAVCCSHFWEAGWVLCLSASA